MPSELTPPTPLGRPGGPTEWLAGVAETAPHARAAGAGARSADFSATTTFEERRRPDGERRRAPAGELADAERVVPASGGAAPSSATPSSSASMDSAGVVDAEPALPPASVASAGQVPEPPTDAAIAAPSEFSPPDPGSIPVPVTVMIDPEAFAKAVAAAIAAVLDARPEAFAPRPAAQWVQATPVGGPPKRSFWSGLWHADVLLAVLAMLIILVILLAWAT